jgi:predicted phage tail protein
MGVIDLRRIGPKVVNNTSIRIRVPKGADMTQTHTFRFPHSAGNWLRTLIAAVLAVAFAGLILMFAAIFAAAALVVVGAAMVAGGAWWLWRKVRGRNRTATETDDDGATVLVARHGPSGWTVDGDDDTSR